MLSEKHSFGMDMTMLERQQTRLKWLQQQYTYVNQNNSLQSCSIPQFQGFFDHVPASGDMIDWKKEAEMYLGSSGLPRYGNRSISGAEFVCNKMDIGQTEVRPSSVEIDHCLSRTSSCQNGALEAAKMEEVVVAVGLEDEDVALAKKMQVNHKGDGSNKRKAEFVETEECKDKRNKGDAEVQSKVKEKNSTENSGDSSKENHKVTEAPKPDYIHVRARRGQATDSHSLAERARREKISKKMKCLQDLVPGCNKITGRAGMLDEIINYVQSLQRQVEFLSMKLATVNPMLEFDVDNFSRKELAAYAPSFSTATVSSTIPNFPHLQLNLVQQQATGCEPDALTNPQILPERTTNSPAMFSELCVDSSHFSQIQHSWETDSQNLDNVGFH